MVEMQYVTGEVTAYSYVIGHLLNDGCTVVWQHSRVENINDSDIKKHK